MIIDVEPLYATILILVVTKQRLLLAADSRRTYLDAKGTRKTGTMQKIQEVNGYYYAIAGFYEDEAKGFSIAKQLEALLLETTEIHTAVQRIGLQLATALKAYLLELQQNHPLLLQQLKRHSASGGEILIIKNVAKSPTAYLIEYHFTEQVDMQVFVKMRFIDCTAIKKEGTCFYRLVGNVTPSAFSHFTEAQWAATPIENIQWVMLQGQKTYPDFVSAPVRIVELTVQGET